MKLKLGDYVMADVEPEPVTCRIIELTGETIRIMSPFGITGYRKISNFRRSTKRKWLTQTNDYVQNEAERIISESNH